MGRWIIAVALLLAAAPASHAQETAQEELEDGRVVTRTYAASGGERVLHGPVTVQARGGRVLAAGRYTDGVRTGRWRFRHPDGSLAASGNYKDGQRVGRWKFQYPGGENRASGKYQRGAPTGDWRFHDEDGRVLDAFSGKLAVHELHVLPRGSKLRGFLLDGALHGPLEIRWPDGAPLLTATYVRGRPVGASRFAFPRGLDADGLGSHEHRGSFPFSDVFGELGDAGRPLAEVPLPAPTLAVSVAALPPAVYPLGRSPTGSWPVDAVAVTAAEYVASDDDTLAASFVGRLRPNAPVVVAWALDALRAVDWAAPDDVERAGRIVERLLIPFGDGLVDGWSPSGPPDANRRVLLRTWAVHFMTALDPAYWQLDVRLPRPDTAERAGLLAELPLFVPVELLRSDAEEPAFVPGPTAPDAASVALGAAVRWLTRVQRPDGSWPSNSGELTAEDGGLVDEAHAHDVGVTALATLALLEAGPRGGPGALSDAAAGALRWLMITQDPATGLIRRPYTLRGPDGSAQRYIATIFIYDHIASTWALCRALQVARTPRLELAAQRAVRYLESARNPYMVWRYAVPPDGNNDTSVTGWALQALDEARRAGLAVDPRSFELAIAWFDEMTDPGTGRCGYDEMGTGSARMVGVNDHMPREIGEPMTALALLGRQLAGQDPDEDPILERHAELLLKTLPQAAGSGGYEDHYYWFFGTRALATLGGKAWARWRPALMAAALELQRQDEGPLAGSWDPTGPWGRTAGRVYTTSAFALSLVTALRRRE